MDWTSAEASWTSRHSPSERSVSKSENLKIGSLLVRGNIFTLLVTSTIFFLIMCFLWGVVRIGHYVKAEVAFAKLSFQLSLKRHVTHV